MSSLVTAKKAADSHEHPCKAGIRPACTQRKDAAHHAGSKQYGPAHLPFKKEYRVSQQITGQPQGHIAQHVERELPGSAHHGPQRHGLPRRTAATGSEPRRDQVHQRIKGHPLVALRIAGAVSREYREHQRGQELMGLRPAGMMDRGKSSRKARVLKGGTTLPRAMTSSREQLHHDPQRERGLPLTGKGAQQQGPEQGPVSQPEDKGGTGYPREDKKKAYCTPSQRASEKLLISIPDFVGRHTAEIQLYLLLQHGPQVSLSLFGKGHMRKDLDLARCVVQIADIEGPGWRRRARACGHPGSRQRGRGHSRRSRPGSRAGRPPVRSGWPVPGTARRRSAAAEGPPTWRHWQLSGAGRPHRAASLSMTCPCIQTVVHSEPEHMDQSPIFFFVPGTQHAAGHDDALGSGLSRPAWPARPGAFRDR